jgi:hypothetical protein
MSFMERIFLSMESGCRGSPGGGHGVAVGDEVGGDVAAVDCMPSTNSMWVSMVLDSSTVITRPCRPSPWRRRSPCDLGVVVGGDGGHVAISSLSLISWSSS